MLKVLSRCWQLRGCDTTYIALSSSKRQDQFHADPANYICTMWSLSSCCCSLDDLSLQLSQGLQAELVCFTRSNWGNKAKKQSVSFRNKGLSCLSLMANRNTEGPVVLSQRCAIACHLIIIHVIFYPVLFPCILRIFSCDGHSQQHRAGI